MQDGWGAETRGSNGDGNGRGRIKWGKRCGGLTHRDCRVNETRRGKLVGSSSGSVISGGCRAG